MRFLGVPPGTKYALKKKSHSCTWEYICTTFIGRPPFPGIYFAAENNWSTEPFALRKTV